MIGLAGVLARRAAWFESKEVDDATYDPRSLNYRRLLDQAKSLACSATVYARDADQSFTAKELVSDRAAEQQRDNAREPAVETRTRVPCGP